ncbi:MAG: cellulase family glycosylhydrolase [Prevotella sp.]|nr:cellulase family glycosylhydrolase [Prevotella sp.]
MRQIRLALAMLAFCLGTYAQDPPTSAPIPEVNPDQVKSAFSDAYTPFTKWERSHGATLETIQISGTSDNVAKLSGDYVAISVGGRNVANMEYLHADIYSPASGGVSQVRFGFSLWSGGEKYADQYLTNTPAGQWTSVDIPLSAFNGYDFSNAQVLRMTMTKTPGNTFYLDNVYFYTTKAQVNTTPTVSAPKPTVPASMVRSMFSDEYESYYNFNCYSSNGVQVAQKTINGTTDKVLEVKDFRWAHWALGEIPGSSTVNLTGLQKIHFDVYVPESNVTTAVQPGMYNVEGKKEAYSGKQTLTPGKWTSVTLKVADFQAVGLSAVNNLTLKDPAGKTGLIYLDNVYFFNEDEPLPNEDPIPEDSIPVDTVPVSTLKSAPTPINAVTDVKSIFSDTYAPISAKFEATGGNAGYSSENIQLTSSDKAIKLKDYTWVKFDLGGTVDASDMTYLHVDLYVPDANVASVQPILVNGNTSYYTGSPTLTAGKWTSLNIKIADYTAKGLNASAISEIRFKHSGVGEMIIDNVYFSKTEGAKGTSDGGSESGNNPPTPSGISIPLAPTPQTQASDVKAFFSDEYTTLFGKFEPTTYSKATVEVLDHDATHKVCRITQLDWCAINLGQRDVSDKGYVHFDFYTPASDKVETINLGFQLWGEPITYETANGDANWRTLPADQWVSIDIPLSNFVGRDFSKDMAGFRIRKTGKGTLYVDNIYFWGQPQDSTDTDYDPDKYPPIQDNTAGELPPMNEPMLGVNLSSASGGTVPGTFGKDYMYPRFQDLYYFKAKGVRLIRFPFRAARVLEDLDGNALDYNNGSTSDIQAMKNIVNEAERLGMWIFLDAHDYAERTINGVQQKLGDEVYTAEKFGRMWRMIAEAFKDNKNIWGYDLQNEPKVGAANLIPIYQAAIDSIRTVDTKAQIIIEGANWASAYEWIYGNRSDKQYPEYPSTVAWSYKESSNWDLINLVDPQNKLVFQAHGYFDQDNSGTYQKGYQDVDFKKRFAPFLEWLKVNNQKGLIGEFGVPYVGAKTGSDERWMTVIDNALDFFRSYQVNATYWCGGAMYEANELSVQPDKNALYGNYSIEKSTMAVLDKYITNWEISETTGISSVNNPGNSHMDNGTAYNLAGQRVDKNYKGLVIINGKKIIRK